MKALIILVLPVVRGIHFLSILMLTLATFESLTHGTIIDMSRFSRIIGKLSGLGLSTSGLLLWYLTKKSITMHNKSSTIWTLLIHTKLGIALIAFSPLAKLVLAEYALVRFRFMIYFIFLIGTPLIRAFREIKVEEYDGDSIRNREAAKVSSQL